MSAYWPFVVIGLFTGSVYALAAMGVVLTYKTVGIFNLAYGAVAMFCAFAYWELHDNWGISAWISIPLLMLVVAPVIGVALEALFRPIVGLSAEVQIVVAIGLLAVFQSAVPLIFGPQPRQLESILPQSTFVLGSHLHVGYDQVFTLVISLAMAAGLWALLRHTKFGTATRAVVDNRDLASLIGVNAFNVRRAAWILSTIFAALVGILLSPDQGLNVNQLILVVIYAFAPAVLGRLVSLPAAYGGGLALGIIVSILSKFANSGTVADVEAAMPYLALFALLVLLGGRLKEAGLAVQPVAQRVGQSIRRPFSIALGSRTVRLDRQYTYGIVGAVVLLCCPLFISEIRIFDVTGGVIYALAALTLVILTGWSGQPSLAQFSFVGVGAFTAGHLAGTHGHSFLFAMLMGMVFAVPCGLVIGLPSLRLSGLYLGLATLAFALIMDDVVFNRNDVSGGQTGVTVARPEFFGINFSSNTALFELCAVCLIAAGFGALVVYRGPIGRRLLIIRDSSLAASTLGVNLTVTKLAVFGVCGAVAAFAGTLYGAWQQAITPQDFMWSTSLEILLLVVVGGRNYILGAVLAGLNFGILQLNLPTLVAELDPLLVAVGAILVARNPNGSIDVTVQQTKAVLALLRPLPRRRLSIETVVDDDTSLVLADG